MPTKRLPILGVTVLLLALTLSPLALTPSQATVAQTSLPAPRAENTTEAVAGLLFIENVGQFDPIARFQVWGGGHCGWRKMRSG